MSYARFGWNGSDVYVFLNVGGYLDCCGCWLNRQSSQFYSTDEMIQHLEEHRKAGHTVPQSCIDGLLEDKEENDNWINKHKPELDSETQNAYNNRVSFYNDVEGRFAPLLGYLGGEPSYRSELTKRESLGDRGLWSKALHGEGEIIFSDLKSYFEGWIKVEDRIKAAIKAGNEHYGTNDKYTPPSERYHVVQPGSKVGVVLKANKDSVWFLGWGTYDGDFCPPEAGEEVESLVNTWIENDTFPSSTKEQLLEALGRSPLMSNPRITLESGEVVWGYQVWWGPADQMTEEWFGDRDIIEVPAEELLKA